MPITNTDAVLWYRVGQFGDMGYGVPNFSNDVGSLNPNIIQLVDLIGQNLFNMMHCEDSDLRTPPSINTCRRVHRLNLRLSQLLKSRAVPPGENNMETVHGSPAGEVFKVYPVPYFKVRNPYMKQWAGWIMLGLCDAMQHTENRKTVEISTAFAGQIGQYMQRVYRNMAIELFGKTREAAFAPDFLLTDEDLAKYDPSTFFTGTEMVDTVPRLDYVLTEDTLDSLRQGIPVTALPELQPWPENLTTYYSRLRAGDKNASDEAGSSTSAGTSGALYPPAPQP